MKTLGLFCLCALLATSCEPDSSEHARLVAAEMQVRYLGAALDNLAQDCARYPYSTEGLKALIERPREIPEARWRGPYLDPERIPQDPWGHDYVYHEPSNRSTNRYDLYSCGPDGVSKSGGDDPDDVSLWRLKPQSGQ
jgi:general secretion pathway protein G